MKEIASSFTTLHAAILNTTNPDLEKKKRKKKTHRKEREPRMKIHAKRKQNPKLTNENPSPLLSSNQNLPHSLVGNSPQH
jgi:hypothetical protein